MTAAWLSAFLFSGYLKELWTHRRPADLNIARARVSVDFAKGPARAHVDYDHEALSGTPQLVRLERPPSWLDLELTAASGDGWIWRHRLWRASGGVETERLALRLGRQRVAWGTAKFWNPTDVLNPNDPLSVERIERPGVDAAYARWALGDLSQAEAVYAPHDDWDRSALLARLRGNRWDTDFSLMGGKAAFSTGTWIAGGDFAANLWEGTLYGEAAYTKPRWAGAVGYERSFPRELALMVEYLNNGHVGGRPSYRRPLTGRHYFGGSVSQEPHALLKLELYGLLNLEDGGQLLMPSATWNALQDLHLTAGWQRFGGGARSEFGRAPNVFFAQAQYYF